MLQWMILPFKRYAEFSGRSRRMEFWSFFLLNFIVQGVLYAIVMSTTDLSTLANSANPEDVMSIYSSMFSGIGLLIPLYGLATFIPNIAVNVRRLHDRDMSGWWLLGLFIGMVIPLLNIVAAIAYLVLMFLPGTVGPNRFGEDPKGQAAAETFA